MEYLNLLIDGQNGPLVTAFLLGVLASISPCPLATNITAVAYLSGEIRTVKNILVNGLSYVLGRSMSYVLLSSLIYFGVSSFSVSEIFQGWGDKVLGPFLIMIGLIMFGVVRIDFYLGTKGLEGVKQRMSKEGYIGSMLLGALFALAFCPYSGIIFFGMLMPLVLGVSGGLLLPLSFALGTGLPVIVLSCLLAFSLSKLDKACKTTGRLEKVMRYGIAAVFLAAGLFYTQFLLKYLLGLW